MYLNSYFLYDIADVKHSLNLNLSSRYFLCFKITDQTISSLPLFYKHLLQSSIKPGFCFYIDLKEKRAEDIKELIQEYIIPCFFHYHYKNDSFGSPFMLASASTGSNNSIVSLLNNTAIEQGFSNIDIITTISYFINSLNTDDEGLIKDYEDAILKIRDVKQSIFFPIASLDEISPLLLKLKKADSIMAAKHQTLMQLLSDYNKLYEDRRQLSFQNGIITQSLESLSMYSSDINEPGSFYKKKIADIVHFYKNEYEILPLWYKRLGHILKVITGKRTFRSLYDDNSKKYKL